MSISDELMLRYYALVSGLDRGEVQNITGQIKNQTLHPKAAKARLASLLVERFYSKKAAVAAAQEFDSIFKEGNLPHEIELETIDAKELKNGKIWLPKAMVLAGVCSSTSDGRRLIAQGAVRVNDQKISDDKAEIELTAEILLQVGKRRFKRIRCV
jgi:tyrosyl-tRNA synthetase